MYLLTYLFTYLFTPWFYGRLRALASITREALSSLSTSLCHHLLTFISHGFFSSHSNHLNLDLLNLFLPSVLLSNIFLTTLSWSILPSCPIHFNLFFLISAAMSKLLIAFVFPDHFLFFIFLVLPLVHINSLIISCPMCSFQAPSILLDTPLSCSPNLRLSSKVWVQSDTHKNRQVKSLCIYSGQTDRQLNVSFASKFFA